MTGIELIAEERQEQLDKHKRSVQYDREVNRDCQLGTAAGILCYELIEELNCENDPPTDWNIELWNKMISKPYKERLIIAGALIAAEIDRIQYNYEKSTKN